MDWIPSAKQEFALRRIEYEILYGGARGGGKTDAGLVWLTDHIDNPRYRALVIRKNAEDLTDWIDRAQRFYGPMGAKIVGRPAEVRFPSGAMLKTGHLKDDQAYTKYQGQEYQRILFEELTQIPDAKRYQMLLGSCRSTVKGIKPQIFATTNPGSLGHVWVRERFIDPSPPMTPFLDTETGRSRIYIPATVDDNPALMENDPGYIKYLDGLKNTDIELWKAWRYGDWTSFAGQFFREWRTDLHVCRPFVPKRSDDIAIVGGLDWGRTDMFVVVFDVIEKIKVEDKVFYRTRTFCEVTGNEKTPQEWGIEIKTKLHNFGLRLDDIAWIRADNQIFNLGNDKGKSIFDQFVDCDERYRTLLKAASKERVGGWENLHNWLSIAPDGLPYWQVAENCFETIKSVTSLVHDTNKVEDVDTDSNDHACFDGHTEVLTSDGYKYIININEGDKVWTPIGWSKVISLNNCGKAKVNNFLRTKVTDNHPFLTQDGFCQLKDLKKTDRLWSVCTFSENHIADTLIRQEFPIRSILGVVQRRLEILEKKNLSIVMSGNSLMDQYQRVVMFTTKIKLTVETILRLWKWSLWPNIRFSIEKKLVKGVEKLSKLLRSSPVFGMVLQKVLNFTEDWVKRVGWQERFLSTSVKYVEEHIKQSVQKHQNSAAKTVKQPPLDEEEVWNLTTDTGMFTAGSVVVSNSDAERYQKKHLKWINAGVGGFNSNQSQSGPKRPVLQVNDEGQEIPIDLDKFAGLRDPSEKVISHRV